MSTKNVSNRARGVLALVVGSSLVGPVVVGAASAACVGDGASADRGTPSPDAPFDDDATAAPSNDAAGDAQASPEVVTQLTAGGRHGCARLSSGAVACWGDNGDGQTGQPKGGAGSFTCALFGGSTECTTRAQIVAGVSGASAVAAGYQHTCALTSTGEVKCWGRNDHGQLGHAPGSAGDEQCIDVGPSGSPVITCNRVPVAVPGLMDVVQITAGETHTCARTSAGAVYCWGDNRGKQLGAASAGDGSAAPVQVTLPGGVRALDVATGFAASTCAVVATSQVYCWGMNFWGQLGHVGNDEACPAYYGEPCQVTPSAALIDPTNADAGVLTGATRAHTGESQTCIQQKSASGGGDRLVCWGLRVFALDGAGVAPGELLRPTATVETPVETTSSGVAARRFSQCVLTSTGGRSCWGKNNAGELGTGALTAADAGSAVLAPVTLADPPNLVEIVAGHSHMLARDAAGKVWAWGSNVTAQLGHAPGSAGDVACEATATDPSLSQCAPKPVAVEGLPPLPPTEK